MAKASSKGASSKTSVQYRALLHYERQWLPPLSPANVFGAALFFFYVGSAVLSAFKPHGAPMSTFTRAKEIAACTAMPPLNTSCLGHAPPRAAGSGTSPVRRTLYMQPYGALGSRLRGVASGLTLGEEVGADVVIVWRDSEYGFTGAWSDLFAAPALPLGCFPGQSLLPESAKCTIHTVNHHSEWEAVKDRWEQMPDGAGGVREVLCLKSVMYLTPKQREVGWFYKLLEPAARCALAGDALLTTHTWAAVTGTRSQLTSMDTLNQFQSFTSFNFPPAASSPGSMPSWRSSDGTKGA